MSFETLGVAPALLRALSEQGYTTPTPIQADAIPLVLAGHDLLGGAQTGTGKTAAFGLPLLQRLSARTLPKGPRKPRALVLVPTRELAVQVEENLRAYARHLPLRTATMFGGVGMNPQIDAMRRGVDVLVACPGRLIDHMGQGTVQLDAIEVLVLDEADRMLDMGFLHAIKRILAKLPAQRQTLLFSATFEAQLKALALQFMRDPKQVQVASGRAVAETISHRAHPVDSARKRDLLVEILSSRHTDQAIVFGRTKHGCNRLAEQLEKSGLSAVAIHGNKSQAQRQKALNAFKAGKARVLVATDVAARGLDIPDLPLVINFELPMVAEDYVHRIGRTGRNGANGEAISLVSHDEGGLLRQIHKVLAGRGEVEVTPYPGYEPAQPLRLDVAIPNPRQKSGDRPARAQRNPSPRGHTQPKAGDGRQHTHAGPARRRSRGGRRTTGAGA